jgi:hypothetical protein
MMYAAQPCCQGLAGSWTDWFQSITQGWSQTGQQILLNQNQPLVMETGAGGTKVYQTGPGTPGAVLPTQPSTPERVVQSSFSGLSLLILGGVALILLLRTQGEGD